MRTFGQPETAREQVDHHVATIERRIAGYHKEQIEDAQSALDNARLALDTDAALLEGWREVQALVRLAG